MFKRILTRNVIVITLSTLLAIMMIGSAYCLYTVTPSTQTIILTTYNPYVTYTFTHHPAWVLNDQCVVIVYCFNTSTADKTWVQTVYDSDTDSFSATIDRSLYDSCNLVRFAKGTTAATADWDNKYNQTSNLLLTSTTIDTSGKWT